MNSEVSQAPRIFISYRRAGSAEIARRMERDLRRAFGEESVFFDGQTELGEKWPERCAKELARATVMMVLIDSEWLAHKDSSHRRLIDRSTDWVRIEVKEALARRIRIIPVALSGAEWPMSREHLPPDIADIVDHQGLSLSDDIESGVRLLMDKLRDFGLVEDGRSPLLQEAWGSRGRLRFVHLSDLHFGIGAGPDRHDAELLLAVEERIKELEPDHVFITGDISGGGDQSEMLQAHTWLASRVLLPKGASTGLSLRKGQYHVCPGNTDRNPSAPHRKREGLKEFREAFPDSPHVEANRYVWLPSAKFDVVLVLIDSSFYEDDSRVNPRPSRSKMDKLLKGRTEELQEFYHRGSTGKLVLGGAAISATRFHRAKKIVAVHHPFVTRTEIDGDLQNDFRRALVRDLMLSRVDVVLCGHRHIDDVSDREYTTHIDPRATVRTLKRLVNGLLGIAQGRFQMTTKDGLKFRRWLSVFVAGRLIAQRETAPSLDLDRVVAELREALVDANAFRTRIENLICATDGTGTSNLLSPQDLQEAGERIQREFSRDERLRLAACAEDCFSGVLNRLKKRLFLQIRCGSTTKAISAASSQRSFNVYDFFEDEDGIVKIKVARFKLVGKAFQRESKEVVYSIRDHQQLALPF